jgi:4-hydroxybenzoate polyprenyltransferase
MNIYKLFQLIRLPNLLILGLMQVLLRVALAVPVMQSEEIPTLLSTEEILLVIISCMLIAAGGYIINDISDEAIDTVNRPETVIVGKHLTSGQAYSLYFIFTVAGLLIGFYLSYFEKVRYVGTINAVAAGLLYFYSTSYKCIPLLGNLIVALLTALSVYIIAFPEPLLLSHPGLFSMFTGFASFAFLYTLVRELIKDLEDQKGDHAADCRTLVQATSEKTVKRLAAIILFITICLLAGIQVVTRQWETIVPFIYLLLFVQIPSIYLLQKILRSHTKADFRFCSKLSKLIMMAGILSLLIFYFSI